MDGLAQPIVAAVGGPAVEGGLELLLCWRRRGGPNTRCFRHARGEARTHPRRGGTQRLPRRVGELTALELLLTGRLVDAAEAKRIELVTRVVDVRTTDEVARDVARRLARTAPLAARSAKATVHAASSVELADGQALERRHFLALMSLTTRSSG